MQTSRRPVPGDEHDDHDDVCIGNLYWKIVLEKCIGKKHWKIVLANYGKVKSILLQQNSFHCNAINI